MKNSNEVEIIPAILEQTLEAIEEKMYQVRGVAQMVQLDVVDGIFAPQKTWPYGSAHAREEFEKIASQSEGFPLWNECNFEADLMISHPERDIEKWVAAGFCQLVIHADSEGALEAMKKLQNSRGEGFRIAVALSSKASPEDLKPFAGLYEYVQVMGIERVGFQGQEPDERARVLISQLRQAYPELTIQVDGGVRIENARALVESGASRLITGSAVFASENPKVALEALRRAANPEDTIKV